MEILIYYIHILFNLLEVQDFIFSAGFLSGIVYSLLLLSVAWALVLIALGFLCWALYLGLLNFLSPFISALICVFFILLAACILVLIAKKRKSVSMPDKKELPFNISAGDSFHKGVSFIRKYPRVTIATSLIAGLLVGTSSTVRGGIGGIFRTLLKAAGTKYFINKYLG